MYGSIFTGFFKLNTGAVLAKLTAWYYRRQLASLVDDEWYLEANHDARNIDLGAPRHFLKFGLWEHLSPNEYFSSNWYRSAYPKSFDVNTPPVLHYLSRGWKAGMDPGPLFDSQQYLIAYPDVASFGYEPLSHYIRHGRREKRQVFEARLKNVGTAYRDWLKKITLSELKDDTETRLGTAALASDDILQVIAAAYRRALKREASFLEVFERLKLISDVTHSLNDALESIYNSEEAVEVSKRDKSTVEIEPANFAAAMEVIYRAFLGRQISKEEITVWEGHHRGGLNLAAIIMSLYYGDEARQNRTDAAGDQLPIGSLVQLAIGRILRRGASSAEVSHYRTLVEQGTLSFSKFLDQIFRTFVAEQNKAVERENDPSRAILFGAQRTITLDEWRAKVSPSLAGRDMQLETAASTENRNNFAYRSSEQKPLVSIITSLYKGGEFIETFLDNITSQSIFGDCELIIIDANSPDGETTLIQNYITQFKNIKYIRTDTTVGIYTVWNMGLKLATGLYCTNCNLDDCRRVDSIERQAAILDKLSFVDVVYQDVLYFFTANIPFYKIASAGLATRLPIVSRYNLMEFNMPHNGPMWRRALHNDVGYFNEDFKSAGDYEFWIRCKVAGKTFYKSNDAHVAYYVNPNGISTRQDTLGVVEANLISDMYFSDMVSPNVTCSVDDFLARLGLPIDLENLRGDRYAATQLAMRGLSKKARMVDADSAMDAAP